LKPTIGRLREDAQARQRAQQTVERARMGPDRAGQGRGVLRTVLEHVGDAQLRGDMDQLRRPEAHKEITDDLVRRPI